MNQSIANIIKGYIEDLDFVDKIAGLTQVATFEIKGKDNTVVEKTVPIACCVTAEDCKEGAYNDLMPDSQYKTVIYFEDKGVSFVRSESNWKYYTSELRLVCWINIEKILGSSCKNDNPCTYAAHIIAEIIRHLPEHPQNVSPFSFVYPEITNQEIRSNSIFSQYTYDEKHSQYLMAPYDYFALDITTNFAICMQGTDVYDATCESDDENPESEVFYDIDGNAYTSVFIGDLEFMVQNLKTTKYKDGTLIPYLPVAGDWGAENGTSEHDGAFCYPDNDIANKVTYGLLYNHFAVCNSHGLAPEGWRVTTKNDIDYLMTYLGGVIIAGNKMKEAGTYHWGAPNAGADNSSGFTGLPAGIRRTPIWDFYEFLTSAWFWSSTISTDNLLFAWLYILEESDGFIQWQAGHTRPEGFSVRCVRGIKKEIECIDQTAWCSLTAIPDYWDYTDGGWLSDGSRLICDGTSGAIGNGVSIITPSVAKVKISVVLISGTLEAPYDGVTSALLINTSGTYEYDYAFPWGSGVPGTGMYILSNSFIGIITELSIIGKYE